MRIIHFPLLFIILFISTTVCKEDSVNKANVENLKILRNSVNFAYKAGNNFLDIIRGSTPPHEPIQHIAKMLTEKRDFKLNDFVPVFLPFVGIIVLILLGLIFIIFVPIVGFCFCLCRCCGKCGGKIKGMDPKHATCKRYTYALFLGIISVVQLAGIVLAFINNQLIHDTLTNPSEEINAIKQLTIGNDLFKGSLKNISEAIKDSERVSSKNDNNVDITKTNFMDLTCTRYLSVVMNDTESLNINTGLQKISSKIDDVLNYFNKVKFEHEKLKKYGSDFSGQISNLKIINIRSKVCDILANAVNTDFDDLKNIIREEIKQESSTGAKLKEIVNFLNQTIVVHLDKGLRMIEYHFKVEYLEYRMYVCIGVCCLLLLIVLFYFLGLCFGQCGERPFEDARICNRGVGANLMMAGVAFAFLFTPIIMMFEIILFMQWAPVQTEACRYLTNSFEPGVKSLDFILITYPIKNPYIKNNILDSVINLCPSEPMTKAFKIDTNLMSQEVIKKNLEIYIKVKNITVELKQDIINGYFKNVESLLLNISAESRASNARYDGFDAGTKETIYSKLKAISTGINDFGLTNIKSKFLISFDNAAINGFRPALNKVVDNLLHKIYVSSYQNVRCNGISKSAVTIIDATCVTFLWPFNGFWYGVGICLIFTIPAIIFAVKLAGLYRRTEKYSADYEEPDYHSYMGFYTNNADNIPMKRPKSAKSNSKNRNSNSNNKDSVKQNNPQYLPVYPYDAYE